MTAAGIRLNRLGITVALVFAFCIVLFFSGLRKNEDLERISLKKLLIASLRAAENAGKHVVEIRNSQIHLDTEVKSKTREGANEYKTLADSESHKIIVNGLQKTFPSLKDKIISEEHVSESKAFKATLPLPTVDIALNLLEDEEVSAKDITVWVDPLDATQEYTENLTQYVTVMVCVAVKGIPTIGVVNFPFEEKVVWAYVGHGQSSHLNEGKVSSPTRADGEIRVIVSRSHAGKVTNISREAFGEKTVVMPAGGAGYKAFNVTQGQADAYVHVTAIKKWDICAGNAILKAVGGKMTTLKGQTIDYHQTDDFVNKDGLLATLHKHEYFLSKISQVGKV